MIEIIKAVLAIIVIIIRNSVENNVEKKEEREGIRNELNEALKTRDVSRINIVIGKLRKP